jgi:competence protein ComEA
MFTYTRQQLIAASTIIVLTLAAIGVLVARSGVFHSSSKPEEVEFIESGSSKDEASGSTEVLVQEKVCVHVVGEVKNPGVYELELGSRVKDAIEAAGGALPDADLENINLAEKLSDGEQIYIASKGQIPPPITSVVRGGEKSAGAVSSRSVSSNERSEASKTAKLTHPSEGLVNINTANLEELQRLPGVGPVTAQRILEYRNRNGRFESVDELMEVEGIGPSKLEKMRPFVRL